MKSGTHSWTQFMPILLPVYLIFALFCTLWAGETTVEITNGDTEKRIGCTILQNGETLILLWTNSLFRLSVTETYRAHEGMLVQTGVAFAEPNGKEPPFVRPDDVEDLYHTGGPFRAEGLSRQFQKIVFRVGEIGNPVLKIQGSMVSFAKEVGFGGTVILESRLLLSNEKACHLSATNASEAIQ